jgi:hypothetical protein
MDPAGVKCGALIALVITSTYTKTGMILIQGRKGMRPPLSWSRESNIVSKTG